MVVHSLDHIVELMDRAFNEGDVSALLGFYEDAAVVVTGPGQAVRGREELRRFFEQVMQSGSSAKQLKTHVLEAEGIALFISRWTLETKGVETGPTARTLVATTVFRRQSDGGWKALIDNSIGPMVLGPE